MAGEDEVKFEFAVDLEGVEVRRLSGNDEDVSEIAVGLEGQEVRRLSERERHSAQGDAAWHANFQRRIPVKVRELLKREMVQRNEAAQTIQKWWGSVRKKRTLYLGMETDIVAPLLLVPESNTIFAIAKDEIGGHNVPWRDQKKNHQGSPNWTRAIKWLQEG